MSTADYRSLARGETTKRLIVQLIHEKLVLVSLLHGPDQPRACVTGPGDKKRWMTLPIRDSFCLSKHLRPNDFGSPAILYHDGTEATEDDPGSIFKFAAAWFKCDEQQKSDMVAELRNPSRMLGAQWISCGGFGVTNGDQEKWMTESDAPMLNINSSLLDWEICLVVGHPYKPLCRGSLCVDQLLNL